MTVETATYAQRPGVAERLSVFRTVRDEVRRRVEEFLTDGTQGAETRWPDGTRRIPFAENGGH